MAQGFEIAAPVGTDLSQFDIVIYEPMSKNVANGKMKGKDFHMYIVDFLH